MDRYDQHARRLSREEEKLARFALRGAVLQGLLLIAFVIVLGQVASSATARILWAMLIAYVGVVSSVILFVGSRRAHARLRAMEANYEADIGENAREMVSPFLVEKQPAWRSAALSEAYLWGLFSVVWVAAAVMLATPDARGRWRPTSSDSTSTSPLLERVPTLQQQDVRHRELVAAIRESARIRSDGDWPVAPFHLPAGLYLVIATLAVAGSGTLIIGMRSSHKYTRITTGVIGGSSLVGSLVLGKFALAEELKFSPEFRISTGDTYQSGALTDLGAVGPFATARPDTLESAGASSLAAVEDSLRARRRDWVLEGMFLIGSADRRELRGSVARSLGSNQGLAQLRAEWLRTALVQGVPLEASTVQVVTFVRGPVLLASQQGAGALAPDRSV
ncbi:MAG: hypothetical protein U0704_10175 [Candidatus Eisenbacteria bacterium]